MEKEIATRSRVLETGGLRVVSRGVGSSRESENRAPDAAGIRRCDRRASAAVYRRTGRGSESAPEAWLRCARVQFGGQLRRHVRRDREADSPSMRAARTSVARCGTRRGTERSTSATFFFEELAGQLRAAVRRGRVRDRPTRRLDELSRAARDGAALIEGQKPSARLRARTPTDLACHGAHRG